jgi:hypothetical protein
MTASMQPNDDSLLEHYPHPTLTADTLIRPCACVSSFLLPCHHSRHSIANERRIALSTNMNLTP